jgi:hypothetical protein
VAIDVLAGAPVSTMGSSPDYSLTAAPNGDLVALWYHNAVCTAATYRTSGTCRYYHYARYRSASNTWEAPVLLTDASNPGFDVYTNDRGDLVFFGSSWAVRFERFGNSTIARAGKNNPVSFGVFGKLGKSGPGRAFLAS